MKIAAICDTAYDILLAGGFNQENAASAIIAAALTGASSQDAQDGLKKLVYQAEWIN